MKKLLTLLLLMAVFGCKTPTKKKEEKPVVIKEPVKEVVVEKKVEKVEKIETVEKIDNTLISLRKDPCSGDCPAFTVSISKDSIFTFEGKQYTAYSGKKEFKLSNIEYDKLISVLRNSDFKDLKRQYASQNANDFSKNTITYQGKSVSVRLWKDAPKELTKIYVVLEDILYERKLLE